MVNRIAAFGKTAIGLARNPLGIIALFIVLIYGLACLLMVFTQSSLPEAERLPIVYFLVVFPVLVLAVFAWLVSRHSRHLFAPGDFKNEENYVKMQMAVVASLTAATKRTQGNTSKSEIDRIMKAVQAIEPTRIGNGGRRNHILWVDDRPEYNEWERQAFESVGLRITLALSTNEALSELKTDRFVAIISDMRRREGPREGLALLDQLRDRGDATPFYFYRRSIAPEHARETAEHGGQGSTSDAEELFSMVMRTVMGQAGS